jgi:hypothetical protein
MRVSLICLVAVVSLASIPGGLAQQLKAPEVPKVDGQCGPVTSCLDPKAQTCTIPPSTPQTCSCITIYDPCTFRFVDKAKVLELIEKMSK